MPSIQCEQADLDRLDFLAKYAVEHAETKDYYGSVSYVNRILVLREHGFEFHSNTCSWVRELALAKVWNTKTKGFQVKSLCDVFGPDTDAFKYFRNKVSEYAAERV